MPDNRSNREPKPLRECNASESKEFVRLLTANQHRIFAFILTLIPDWPVAEDILQDTSEVMWIKYAEVRPVDNFPAWAMRIAHNKILNYLTKHQNQHVLFCSEVLEEVAKQTETLCHDMDERIAALETCMSHLNPSEKHFLHLRYEDNLTIKQIAQDVGRPVHGMYKKMARLHEILLRCIQRRLTGGVELP